MISFEIPGVYDTATSSLVVNPEFTAGQWQIAVGGGAFANLESLPLARGPESAIVDVSLSTAENVEGAVVRFEDPSRRWIGPTATWPFVVTQSFHQAVESDLRVVRGDRHDGYESPKLFWGSDKSFPNAKPVTLLIFDGPTVLAEGSGLADGNTITIDDIELEFDESLFRGNPLKAKLRYAVVAGTKETLRYGRCQVEYRADID